MHKICILCLFLFTSLLYAEPAVKIIDLNQNADFDDIYVLTMVKSLDNDDIVVSYEKEWSDIYLSPDTYLIMDENLNRKTFFDISLMDTWGKFEVKEDHLLFKKDGMIFNIEAYTGLLYDVYQSEHFFLPFQDDTDKRNSQRIISFLYDSKLWILDYYEDYSFVDSYHEIKLPDTFSPLDATIGLESDEALILVHDDSGSMSVWNYNLENDSFLKSLFLPEEKIRTTLYTSQLTYSPENSYWISVSPDNNWIVLYSQNKGGGLCIFEVYSVQEDRIYTTSISVTEGEWVSEPDWSFDSSYFLMFERGESKLIYKVTL